VLSILLAGAVILVSAALLRAGDSLHGSAETVIPYLLQWGEGALEDNRFSEAEARFREILAVDWNHPRAFELLQETRRRREDSIRAWRAAANIAEGRGNWSEAERLYVLILRERPGDGILANSRDVAARRAKAAEFTRAGLERFLLDDYEGAQLEFEQALLLAPDDSVARAGRDRTDAHDGQSTGLDDLRGDAAVWAQYLDALKHFRAGDLANAERLWKTVLDKYPGNEAVRSNLEQINRRRKQVAATADEDGEP
jgi:tetratricopeptide (TPR) repeat protein